MKEAFRLLEIVTNLFPPAPGCAHLDPSDLERAPEAIVEDIAAYLRSVGAA